MADGEELELNEDLEIGGDDEVQQPPEDQGEDEVVIEFEGAAAEEEPPLVKKLRQQIRERDRKLAEARPQEQEIVVGEKPTLESCEYDADRLDAEYEAWQQRKLAAERQQQNRQTAEQQRAAEYRDLEIRYRASAARLPVKQEEFDAADQAVRAALPEAVQVAIAKYIDEPAKVVLALGKYPAKLDAIAAEPDPVRQLFMIRDLQGAIKVTTRRPAPTPDAESIQRGSAPVAPQIDKESERLYKEGQKSGDMTAYLARQRQLRKKAA